MGSAPDETEIIGVVADVRHVSLSDEPHPMVYVPTNGAVSKFEIRTAIDPNALMPTVRATANRFDSNLLISYMKTVTEQIDGTIYQERLIAGLSSLFALLALILACVGIYGLLSYQVSRRTREIGVRLALGAQRSDVLRNVLGQGVVLAVLGAMIGTAAALAVTRYLQSFLFGVKPYDPVIIAPVAFGLIAVALFASYIPARRAMKTDPMVALRYE
jgi:ABC-type antimicrobial peptide transport system permease subunit